MKLVIFTSNGIRHKYLANTLSECVDDTLVICEHHENNPANGNNNDVLSPIEEHFNLRTLTEQKFFSGNDSFMTDNVLDLMYKEASSEHSYETVKEFNPDLMVVFGSSIIKEHLLSPETKQSTKLSSVLKSKLFTIDPTSVFKLSAAC